VRAEIDAQVSLSLHLVVDKAIRLSPARLHLEVRAFRRDEPICNVEDSVLWNATSAICLQGRLERGQLAARQ
jgi:hypothetical protein